MINNIKIVCLYFVKMITTVIIIIFFWLSCIMMSREAQSVKDWFEGIMPIFEGRRSVCLAPGTFLLPPGTWTSWNIVFSWKFISTQTHLEIYFITTCIWVEMNFLLKWCFNWSMYLVVTDTGNWLGSINQRNAN